MADLKRWQWRLKNILQRMHFIGSSKSNDPAHLNLETEINPLTIRCELASRYHITVIKKRQRKDLTKTPKNEADVRNKVNRFGGSGSLFPHQEGRRILESDESGWRKQGNEIPPQLTFLKAFENWDLCPGCNHLRRTVRRSTRSSLSQKPKRPGVYRWLNRSVIMGLLVITPSSSIWRPIKTSPLPLAPL